MKRLKTRGRRRKVALVPLFAVLFWIAAVVASTIPSVLVLGINVHGLSLASYAGDPMQHVTPLSQRVVHELGQGSNGLSPVPATTGSPSDPRPAPSRIPAPIATPTPSESPLATPSTNPMPTALPLPAPSPAKAAISGQVMDTVSHAPIVGAIVNLSPGRGTTVTDVNGNYSFAVNPGTYTVTASAAGYSSDSQTVAVNGGQNQPVNFKLVSLTATGSIKGTVTDNLTATAIAGATVSLSNGLATVTDANGNFSFPVVLYGSYTITASAAGYLSQGQPVTVKPGHLTTINFQLAR
ncbi:MAG TPA: carboxypeptidase regulatory-like domain-containing protein [Candidatus Dormibacteraeota bacterium]